MKYRVLLFVLVSCAAQAEEKQRPLILSPTELDPVTVYGKAEPMPCLGCERTPQGPSPLLDITTGLAIWAVKPFFQQPRVRGEANDEAAYYALRAAQCIDDSPGCLDRHPNPNLHNWQPDNVADDTVLHPANASLAGE